jgi:hypothetical protein
MNKSTRKLISEGILDEIGGAKYYANLVKKLKSAGVPPSQYKPFISSMKEERKHLKRLRQVNR